MKLFATWLINNLLMIPNSFLSSSSEYYYQKIYNDAIQIQFQVRFTIQSKMDSQELQWLNGTNNRSPFTLLLTKDQTLVSWYLNRHSASDENI